MEQRELQEVIEVAISTYQGNVDVLESAIGALHVGLRTGWRPLRLMHTHKTFVRYQAALGLDFHEVMPEVGPLAEKSLAWRIASKVKNFWDAARGSIPAARSKEIL